MKIPCPRPQITFRSAFLPCFYDTKGSQVYRTLEDPGQKSEAPGRLPGRRFYPNQILKDEDKLFKEGAGRGGGPPSPTHRGMAWTEDAEVAGIVRAEP